MSNETIKETKNLNVPIKIEVLDGFKEKLKNDYGKDVSIQEVVELLLEGYAKGKFKLVEEKIIKLSLPE